MDNKAVILVVTAVLVTSMLSAMLSAIAVSSVVTTVISPSQIIFNLQEEIQDLEITCSKEVMDGTIVLELDGEKQYCLIRKKEV